MTQILENRLYLIGYNGPVLINAVAAYAPTKGVKGGLRFMKCSKTTTGVYRAQLKNIFTIKNGVTDLTDGNFTFDFTRVKFYQTALNFAVAASGGDLSIYSCAYVNEGDEILSLLSFNSAGALVDSSTDLNTPHSITFLKFKRGLS